MAAVLETRAFGRGGSRALLGSAFSRRKESQGMRDINRDAFFLEDRGTVEGSGPSLKEHNEFTLGYLQFRGGESRAIHYDSAVYKTGSGYFITEDRTSPNIAPDAPQGVWAYAPATVASRVEPIEVVLLFGVGADIFRHGLTRGFYGTTRVLFDLPGTEAHKVHWGAGITKDQIDALLSEMGFAGRPWGIRTIAAFSTGYRGCFLTIRNSVPRAGFRDTGLASKLAALQKLVLFDCVYKEDSNAVRRDDRNPPIKNLTSSLENVLTDLDSMLTSPVRVVANDLTQGGSTWGDRAMPMDQQFRTKVAPRVRNLNFEWNNLRETPTGKTAPPRMDIQCLAMARRLQEAIEDGLFTLADLQGALTAAGQTLAASRIEDLLRDVTYAPHGTPDVKDFAAPVAQFQNFPTSRIPGLNADVRKFWINAQPLVFRQFLQGYSLPGWPPPTVGEFAHDSFIAEFGPQELST